MPSAVNAPVSSSVLADGALTRGERGDEVAQLQGALNAYIRSHEGWEDTGDYMVVDGIYGKTTDKVVEWAKGRLGIREAGAGPEMLRRFGVASTAAPGAGLSPPTTSAPTSSTPAAPAPMTRADELFAAFAPRIGRTSDGHAGLRVAIDAYLSYTAANPNKVANPHFFFVDMGLSSNTPRGYVLDMRQGTLVMGPFKVAHGKPSSESSTYWNDEVPHRFSNTLGSNLTALGLYGVGSTWSHWDRHDQVSTHASALTGLSGDGLNSAAREREIIIHGYAGVRANAVANSQGCPAVSFEIARRLCPLMSQGATASRFGGLTYIYSPRGELSARDPWARAE